MYCTVDTFANEVVHTSLTFLFLFTAEDSASWDDGDADVDLNSGSQNDEPDIPTMQSLQQSHAAPTPDVVSDVQEGVANEGSNRKGTVLVKMLYLSSTLIL